MYIYRYAAAYAAADDGDDAETAEINTHHHLSLAYSKPRPSP